MLQTQKTNLQQQNNAYGSLVSALKTLQTDSQALQQSSLYSKRAAAVGGSTILSATAADGTVSGSYTFHVTQQAAAAFQNGGTGIGGILNSSNDVSGLVLANAAFSQPVTAGTMTINGSQITLATTDTLQQVFDKIHTATGGAVTGGYDSTTDAISLTSGSPITVGSATDTSNLLQVAQLYNNGTGTITSANPLGAVQLTSTLANSNLGTVVTGDTNGNGQFTINGVAINYNLNTDTVNDVLNRINSSAAGADASYDYVNDRFVLTNKSTGDVGIALQDVTGNFLAASKLSTGAFNRGQNLLYTLNGGGQRVSYSNTIADTNSGVTGLSVTALNTGTTTVQVQNDSSDLKTAITNFVADYNKVQSLIDSQTTVSTDSQGNVTPSPLTGDFTVADVASKLRSALYGQISGLTGDINQLATLGYSTNGQDNTIALKDSTALDNALNTDLSGVQDFFTNATKGMAVNLSSSIDNLVGDNGSLVSHQTLLTKQSTDIDNQVAAIEKLVQADSTRLTNEFIAMEQAQAQINQQQTFLTQAINSNTL